MSAGDVMPASQANSPGVFSIPRLTTLITSIFVALGSGTNYVFSAYAPQLGSRLNINHTQLNIVGIAGNAGVYSSGPIWGRFVDLRGPRMPFIASSLLLFTGYAGIRYIYDKGLAPEESTISSTTFILLIICGYITGTGGNAGVTSAINSTAKSFPDNARATTVGLVLSGFGLSAFLFSSISRLFFPGDTSSFLLVLATGTVCPMIVGYFLVRPIPYARSTPSSPSLRGQPSRMPISDSSMGASAPLLANDALNETPGYVDLDVTGDQGHGPDEETLAPADSSHFMSRRRALLAGDVGLTNVSGKRLARSSDFWLLFSILSLLSGAGLMYINNVGSMSQALYAKETPVYDDIQAAKWQTTQVSTISIMNCVGRVFLGLICDYGKNKLGIPRSYSLVLVSFLLLVSQIVITRIDSVKNLWIASSTLGFAYGSTFSLLATMCVEWFGMPHFSENWGFLSMAPMVGGNLFSIIFGRNLDAHETIPQPSDRSALGSHVIRRAKLKAPPRCTLGKECYIDSLYLTIGTCFLSILLSLWACWRDKEKMRKAARAVGT